MLPAAARLARVRSTCMHEVGRMQIRLCFAGKLETKDLGCGCPGYAESRWCQLSRIHLTRSYRRWGLVQKIGAFSRLFTSDVHVSILAEAPFQSYLAAMARTGVLVSRHGPQLANSMFLPPGDDHLICINTMIRIIFPSLSCQYFASRTRAGRSLLTSPSAVFVVAS